MSFGGSTADYKAAAPRKPAGVDEQRFSTNEQAKPVPYFAGYRRQAVTFITEIFKQVKAGVNAGQNGGGKAPGGRSGTKYYGSFACLIGYVASSGTLQPGDGMSASGVRC